MIDIAEKIQLGISYLLRSSLVVAAITAVVTEQWINLFAIVVILFLTFLPAIISHNYKISLPIEFDLIIVLFTYASLYLGVLHSFYFRFDWWDLLLHGSSALIFGFIGFLIVYILNHEKRLEIHMVPRFVAIFSFAFALSIGAIWEIFEFTMDHLFGLMMQKASLTDTMTDLIIDAVGAVIASLLGYVYVKHGETFFFHRLIRKFTEKNPNIFGEKSKQI